tara:strand:- start:238 stop:426 length:189 start_codon:yes stop_codon:yes gene_type:complete
MTKIEKLEIIRDALHDALDMKKKRGLSIAALDTNEAIQLVNELIIQELYHTEDTDVIYVQSR